MSDSDGESTKPAWMIEEEERILKAALQSASSKPDGNPVASTGGNGGNETQAKSAPLAVGGREFHETANPTADAITGWGKRSG